MLPEGWFTPSRDFCILWKEFWRPLHNWSVLETSRISRKQEAASVHDGTMIITFIGWWQTEGSVRWGTQRAWDSRLWTDGCMNDESLIACRSTSSMISGACLRSMAEPVWIRVERGDLNIRSLECGILHMHHTVGSPVTIVNLKFGSKLFFTVGYPTGLVGGYQEGKHRYCSNISSHSSPT